MQLQNGSLRLFHLFGIDVFLHWSWLIIAYFRIKNPIVQYELRAWAVAEYLSLFGIVLLHEFGHALACRSVGGTAQRIVLWPLGGIAYVTPPPRPGAVLWSLAAGPLVNVVLLPVTIGIVTLSVLLGGLQPAGQIDGAAAPPAVEKAAEAPGVGNAAPEAAKSDAARPSDLHQFLTVVAIINLVLLVFNMLPIYPLDGGQIVHALLWFVIGRAKSLMLVTGVSLVAGVGLIGLAAIMGDWWLMVLTVFGAIAAWNGLRQSRFLIRMLRAPRHTDLACPSCGEAPPAGQFWGCGRCRSSFDLFATGGVCPGCGAVVLDTACSECGVQQPVKAWSVTVAEGPLGSGVVIVEPGNAGRTEPSRDTDRQSPPS